MAREIRISIGDDEVFERMKRRKQALDLSWEEVLHRGLRHVPEDPHDPYAAPGPRGPPSPPDPHGHHGHHDYDEFESFGRGMESFGEDLARQIRAQVSGSLRESMRALATEAGGWVDEFDHEIDSLAAAEDAVLSFAFLPDEPANRVPLRVDLRTGAEGLEVDVVSVRRGKGVTGTNRFDAGARKEITGHLARGETALLALGDGEETYAVVPLLSWDRDAEGRPTVSDVEITEVRLE
jgi:hypothetical protein